MLLLFFSVLWWKINFLVLSRITDKILGHIIAKQQFFKDGLTILDFVPGVWSSLLIICKYSHAQEKQSLDPVTEHRHWCPWVQQTRSGIMPASPVMSTSLSTDTNEKDLQAWHLVAKLLGNCTEESDNFSNKMKKVLKKIYPAYLILWYIPVWLKLSKC